MKKVYKKPMLLMENFLLSEHIAACSMATANNLNITVDDLRFAGYFIEKEDCSNSLADGFEFEYNGAQLCYHTSVGAVIFSS